MMQVNQISVRQEWQSAWQSLRFRIMLLSALIAVFAILATFPFFFQTIEKREGIIIDDWVLDQLPALDVSAPIFIIIWGVAGFMLFRCIQNPDILLVFSWAYLLLCLARMMTISLVPLDPPRALVTLADPLADIFYGRKFVTKDLFFSGHTSTLFLMGLCLQRKKDKIILFVAATMVGFLLLVQHVHYTLDVVLAPVFTALIWRLGGKISQKASPNWK